MPLEVKANSAVMLAWKIQIYFLIRAGITVAAAVIAIPFSKRENIS